MFCRTLVIAPSNITTLKEALRKHFPEAHAQRVEVRASTTGISCLDELGISTGSLCEIVSEPARMGAGLLTHGLLRGNPEGVQEPIALVDAADAFDPTSANPRDLERLLWVRCQGMAQAIRATDLLLRDGNLPKVLLDLQLCPARAVREVPSSAWHRLRMLAEKSGVWLCAFTAFQTVPCAQSRLILEQIPTLDCLDDPTSILLQRFQGRAQRRGLSFWEQDPGVSISHQARS